MQKTNQVLTRAQTNKYDDIRATYPEIEKEVNNYAEQLKDKIILCNCNDDVRTSNFATYFLVNFNKLHLKAAWCVAYNPEGKGCLYTLSKAMPNTWKKRDLEGDGDFRTAECIELLKKADVIITSPTRKLFHEYMDQLFLFQKKFLIIANINCVTYTDIFSKFRLGKIRFGYTTPKYFMLGNGEPVSFGNLAWYTNLNVKKRKRRLVLRSSYNMGILFGKYPKLDGINIIFVESVNEIPYDYDGLMAVPINYLLIHNSDQFTIVGEVNHGKDDPFDICVPSIKKQLTFKRIVIKANL